MASLHKVQKIEGKSFEFFGVPGDGGFVKIWENGKLKIRRAWLTALIATWLCAALAPVTNKSSGFEMKKRFGRTLAWVKIISNSRGSFMEIGCSYRGRLTSIFVPGGRNCGGWSDFILALDQTTKSMVAKGSGVHRRKPRAPTPVRLESRAPLCTRCSDCPCRRQKSPTLGFSKFAAAVRGDDDARGARETQAREALEVREACKERVDTIPVVADFRGI